MTTADLIAKQAKADLERGIGPQQLAARIRATAGALKALDVGEAEADLMLRASLIDTAAVATAWAQKLETEDD